MLSDLVYSNSSSHNNDKSLILNENKQFEDKRVMMTFVRTHNTLHK